MRKNRSKSLHYKSTQVWSNPRICTTTSFSEQSYIPGFLREQQGKKESIESSHERTHRQRIIRSGKECSVTRFYGRLFLQPKTETIPGVKRWRTIIDFIRTKRIYNKSIISHGNFNNDTRNHEERNVVYFHRPTRCILSHTNTPQLPEMYESSLIRKSITFKAMAMGLNVSARIFRNGEEVESNRNTYAHLHRRLVTEKLQPTPDTSTNPSNNTAKYQVRMADQFSEVRVDTNSISEICRNTI